MYNRFDTNVSYFISINRVKSCFLFHLVRNIRHFIQAAKDFITRFKGKKINTYITWNRTIKESLDKRVFHFSVTLVHFK